MVHLCAELIVGDLNRDPKLYTGTLVHTSVEAVPSSALGGLDPSPLVATATMCE
jgi:hypothetical protein